MYKLRSLKLVNSKDRSNKLVKSLLKTIRADNFFRLKGKKNQIFGKLYFFRQTLYSITNCFDKPNKRPFLLAKEMY